MTLSEVIIQLIRAGTETRQELFTSSKSAEDSVRAFQTEQKERIDELADNTISSIRDMTKQKCKALDNIILELTDYLKMLSDGSNSRTDVDRATKYVTSLNQKSLLQDIAIEFEGDLNVADLLLSVSCLGRCWVSSRDSEIRPCNYFTDGTENRVSAFPISQRIGCRILDEQSWSSSSLSSFTDNNSYYTSTDNVSNNILEKLEKELDIPKEKEQGLIVSSEKVSIRYIGQFQTSKHRTACVIPDITIMDDMSTVLIDHYHNSIQLFSEEFNKLDEKECPYPIGLCRLNKNHVAVSLRRAGQLAIFRVNKTTLLHHRNIKVKCDSYLWQVTCKSSQLYVVCDENNIHVMDFDGEELNVIRSGVSTELGYVRYFDVNDNDRQIYVNERRGLRCINFKGKLQWLFRNDDFPESERDSRGHHIEDVCYLNGVLLATNWTRSKIFQISLNGIFLRNIVVDNLQHPRIMSMLGTRLVVTQFHPAMKAEERRTVKVFEVDDLSKS